MHRSRCAIHPMLRAMISIGNSAWFDIMNSKTLGPVTSFCANQAAAFERMSRS